ncbi:hypothetical protein BDB01DRAFT_441228 [Pilobolus umbonatus]|nr:hypothetical protein BDB01DRAFT_441228 [Pilobolus umbonatus]
MIIDEDHMSSRIFSCPQCPKIFATRSNLKRHMENPNIHNIPYVRSRDQKRWKGHSKKVVSKEETTESNNDRMRKWRAENREKNRQNDLRCRVYRLARQKFGEDDSIEKQGFVREEISRRLGRRMMIERRENDNWTPPNKMRSGIRLMSPIQMMLTPPASTPTTPSMILSPLSDLVELPFYSAPQQKIELPSIDSFSRTSSWSSSSGEYSSNSSSPMLPNLSPTLHSQRRTSSSSISSITSDRHQSKIERRRSLSASNSTETEEQDELCVLPSMHTFLSYASSAVGEDKRKSCIPAITTKGGIKYVESNKILDEFVGVVLNYVDNAKIATTTAIHS